MYDFVDQIMNRVVMQVYRVFQRYSVMKFDELNVLNGVQELYRRLDVIDRGAFLEIAVHYYEVASGDKTFDVERLNEILRTPSRVMKYSYESESVRKRDRLIEAVLATSGSSAEFDAAMRYWIQMTGWFAVEVADKATETARVERGVEQEMWMAEDDAKTCAVCKALDGQIFPIESVPPKPHPNCRCWTVTV